MSNVYVITAGTYSDYHIVTVFGNRELAEKFVGEEPHPYMIEEYEIDRFAEQVRAGLQLHYVSMYSDGSSHIELSESKGEGLELVTWVSGKAIRGNVWATDKQHAAKIANEKRAQLIASGDWPN